MLFINIFLFFTATALNCYPEEQKDNRISYEESFRILCNANILYMYDNEQTTAFFTLFEDENAINIFIELLRESETGVGMFYALLGLFEHDKNLYNEILESIDLSEIIVIRTIRSADFSNSFNLDELKRTIESGRWIKSLKSNRNNMKSQERSRYRI